MNPTDPAARGAEVEPETPDKPAWASDDSALLYHIDAWGQGFFSVGANGHVHVMPDRDVGHHVDLHEIVTGLVERGIETPVLIGFPELLKQRIADLERAFARAINDNDYRGDYRPAYPIKVNQQRWLVEQIESYGRQRRHGLEVGSKPELLAAMAVTAQTPDRMIICNGFKESRYAKHIMLATQLGRRAIAVIENLGELELILEQADAHGVRPHIGVRVNLSTSGSGRWQRSSGDRSKFGLSMPGVLRVVERLRDRDMLDCLELLHCHMGSQLNDIQVINHGINELTRVYVELSRLGVGLQFLDVGGGLGVDYNGSQPQWTFSTNYTLDEYASTVVYRIGSVCEEAGIEPPTIVTEAGRAMVCHHSVMVFNVLGCNRLDHFTAPDALPKGAPRVLQDLAYVCANIRQNNLLESYHDAQQGREEALTLFRVGHLSLEHRALADRLYWTACLTIRDQVRQLIAEDEVVPEELTDLEQHLCDTYFCNFSIFQSLPDAWAIDQVFPIMPIHRLDERPDRQTTLADITCDSDGTLACFVAEQQTQPTLPVHTLREGEPYYLATFLVGAYQETLGDLHNLFGDTHVVHVRVDPEGRWNVEEVIEGDTVQDVLGYLQYDAQQLYRNIRHNCERCVNEGRMSAAESRELLRAYQEGLSGYTYLE